MSGTPGPSGRDEDAAANNHDEAKCGYRDEHGMYGVPLVCGRERGHAGVHIDFTRFNGTVGFGLPGTKSVAFTEDGASPRVREDGPVRQRLADLRGVEAESDV